MKRRGLLGFYIGAGVFAALALVAAFTWKPLAIGYYERQIKRKTPQGKEGLRSLAASQQTLLDWWEKEGWAKYGSGGQ